MNDQGASAGDRSGEFPLPPDDVFLEDIPTEELLPANLLSFVGTQGEKLDALFDDISGVDPSPWKAIRPATPAAEAPTEARFQPTPPELGQPSPRPTANAGAQPLDSSQFEKPRPTVHTGTDLMMDSDPKKSKKRKTRPQRIGPMGWFVLVFMALVALGAGALLAWTLLSMQ